MLTPPRWKASSRTSCWCSGMLVRMPSTTISSSALRMRIRRAVAVVGPADDLADQRVVVRRHGVAAVEVRVDADAVAARGVEGRHLAGAGREGLRVLGVDPALEGVAAKMRTSSWRIDSGWPPAMQQLLACTMSMPVIISVTGMLDLHAGVHLDEEELAVLVQELEGAGAAVADLQAGLHAALALPRRLQRVRDARRRRLFQHLLVPALQRAVAVAEVDGVALAVGQHLEFRRGAGSRGTSPGRPCRRRRRPAPRCGSLNTEFSSAASLCTTRMPRPPPPAAALMMTG